MILGLYFSSIISDMDTIEYSYEEKEELPEIKDQIEEANHVIMNTINSSNDKALLELKKREIIVLVMGTDERDVEIPRSDVLMLAKYYPLYGRITLVSVPRDTKVTIPGYYEDKINHAYAFGQEALMSATIEQLFDVSIDYYLKLSFDNFRSLIDSVGGVQVDVKKDYYYEYYIDIKKGLQVLNGSDAMDYVRFRYDREGDHGRILRQQEVLMSLIESDFDLDEEDLTSVIKDFYLSVNTDIPLKEFVTYYKLLREEDNYEFITKTLETSGVIQEGIWYELYAEDSLTELKKLLVKEGTNE
jgi:LCP family protein required for cell wall assembly